MKSLLEKRVLKLQSFGLIIFAFIVLGLKVSFEFYKQKSPPQFPKVQMTEISPTEKNYPIKKFDPNHYELQDWIAIGFSEKQAKTILKYKEILGGHFESKEQLRKCYAISEEKFREIEPFLLLDVKPTRSHSTIIVNNKRLNLKKKFNPNDYKQEDWMRLGYSEKQAAAIIKYKHYLGGSFTSQEEIKNCFMISKEQFQQMQPFLLLPRSTKKDVQSENLTFKTFDPNTLDLEGWKALGFSKKQAQVIINYKNKILKGSFKSLDDLKNCHVISEEKLSKLTPFIVWNSKPQKDKTAVSTVQETDFSKIDLNDITYKQLLDFGFDEKAAGSYVGFRKKLGGFANKEQILTTYHLDKELATKLINTCPLDASKITKYRLADAPEDWLKNHPYFKYSADKIIYYRTTYPDDNKIWKWLKLKPEYETRMRWYTIN